MLHLSHLDNNGLARFEAVDMFGWAYELDNIVHVLRSTPACPEDVPCGLWPHVNKYNKV